MFTPGPWRYEADRTGGRSYGEGIEVADCRAFCAEELPMVQANARLISAAPEMYEALRAIAERYEECWKIGDSAGLRALGAARAALAKAEGRA